MTREMGTRRGGDALLRAGACSYRGLGSREPRHRHPERAARHVVQPQLVAQVDRVRVSPVLAADSNLHPLARLATLVDRDPHQPADTFLVDRLERITRED